MIVEFKAGRSPSKNGASNRALPNPPAAVEAARPADNSS